MNIPSYAEIGITTNFSFLRGGSHPQDYVHQASELGLDEIKRVLAAIPNVRPPDGHVHRLVGQLIDASVVLILAFFNVLLFESSLDECSDSAA